jgi:alkanesulfonate monooxygenase SsuD/methylene tetrahydromethanopterin reductase-like flavin-dependent oxidoreductase (luciferase family)
VYAEAIDLFAWAETLGFGAAYVFEHHFTDDDYMSSPMVAATAIAARTKQMRVGPDIAILPLYDPVRVAEDGAVLDLISNGRLDFGVGLGYRPEEYAGYGLDIKSKGSRANEALEIIRRLWQGETVSFHGKHFQSLVQNCPRGQSSSKTRRSGSGGSARPRHGVPRGTVMAISAR